MSITKKQALFLLVISLLVNKVQRLPSLISANIGRHGYLVFLIVGAIDVLFLLLALLFNKQANNKTTYEVCQTAGGNIFAKIIMAIFAFYYFSNSLLPYEAVHDLFANILFDNLSWGLYSIILIAAVWFLAGKGLRNIGRLGEIFFYIITISFVVLLALGAITTDYYRILPINDLTFIELLDTCLEYSLWFGDFLIIYMFVGHVKDDGKKLGWKTVVAVIVCDIVLSFAYVVFFGLYQNLSADTNSLIGFISQFSLLELDIGRVDWFLVLFFEIGAVISSGLYIYMASACIEDIFNTKKNILITFILMIALYLLDIFLFKSSQLGASVIASITKIFGVIMITILPLVLAITSSVAKHKTSKKGNGLSNDYKRFAVLKVSTKVSPALNIKIDDKMFKTKKQTMGGNKRAKSN